MCRLPAPVVVSLPVPLLYFAVTLPLFAVAPVPSTTALQLGPVRLAWIPVMVPVVTPLLNDTAFRCHGKWVVFTVKVRPSGPVQVLNDSAVIEPMPVPDSPLPLLTVPLLVEVWQDRVLPVFVSFSVVTPALAVMAPPGLTVQVAATPVLVAASAELADRASTPASAALMTRALPARLMIVMGVPLPVRLARSSRERACCDGPIAIAPHRGAETYSSVIFVGSADETGDRRTQHVQRSPRVGLSPLTLRGSHGPCRG